MFGYFSLEVDGKKVEWEYIGEGWNGDYDPSNSLDTPLLRFSCYKMNNGEWEELADGSYCTRLPNTTPIKILAQASGIIMEALEDSSCKRKLEELSWFCLADFDDNYLATDLERERIVI